ncbi:K02A2.6-like [Cordylochernes scorpioides]|uniref:RNA-directed DNA polymerase n=1 Tax=Cordylochernes scorpioides TaxID=51811 RepID=A0ABY6LIG9_9ARAC|nr:K02A2.6-like [Cordylochernes scorpioides]
MPRFRLKHDLHHSPIITKNATSPIHRENSRSTDNVSLALSAGCLDDCSNNSSCDYFSPQHIYHYIATLKSRQDKTWPGSKSLIYQSMKKTRSNTTMIEQTHNQVPQEPTTDSTVAASLRTLTLCLDQLLNRESEETITYDGDEPAAHFFSQLESQPNFHNLEPARQTRKALSSLRGEPRKIAQDLALLNKTYEEVKESLCAVYPRRPSFTLQEFYELKCTSMAEIETYYKNKVLIGLAINLPKSAIVQALSNGVPRNYGNLLKMAQPSGPEEWLCLAQQLTYEGDNTSTKAAQQRSPRQSRTPSTTVDKTPPYPCRYCGGQHWHAQCQQRGPYQRTFRTFTPAVHSVEQPQRSTGPAGVYETAATTSSGETNIPTSPCASRELMIKEFIEQRPELTIPYQQLLYSFKDIFPINKFNVLPLNITPVKLKIISDKVISLRPYRTPYAYQKEIQDQISQLLKHDIITPSSSPYSSPVTLVRKRDNTMRLCIDFRRVNELVPSDLHPLPLIETVLENLSKARVFSTVDISNAYYQIPIAEESQPLLSFVTQQGQYNFKRLPFGIKSAPQIFERVITQLIHKHHLSFIAHYYDDFVIFSDSSEQHLTHLRLFFKFCLEENLQLNLKKCIFYQNEIDFLGYHITAGTYTPNIKNTEIINAIRTPINVKTLQSFLGAVNVYHKFIPEYARLRHPLNQLLKKNAKWLCSPNCQQAFDKLKQHLATQPVLHLFQEGLPCQVYCDASTQGIAGVLKQVHPDGNIYPVQYYSRALRSYERNYTISELECLAIVECVDKFRVYLLGTRFVIYSDHHALQWLKTIKDPTGRLFRWSLRLSAYDYEVKYLKGSRQYEADLLSRNPFCGFLSTGQIKEHRGELRRDTRYILNDKDLMTIIRRGVTKIIVPPSLRGTLLQRAHRDFNHPGISQMTRLIAAQYYWDGMTNDIRTHVRTCSVCQLVKPPKGPIYGELGQLPPAVLPYELVSLDTISGFAKYGNSQTFLHVVVDHATRYAWAFPSRSTSILTYTQVIKKVMQFGSPKRLLTDRAPAFTSPKFRRFLIRHNIGQLLTTSNNPQANGLSERLNATITGKLKLLRLQQPKTAWTKLLPQVLQAYNHTPHSVTGFPPSYLLLGSFPLQLSEHVQNYPKIDDARELAYQRTHERHLRDKARFDQTHRASDFEFEKGRYIGYKEASWSNRLIAVHLCRSDAAFDDVGKNGSTTEECNVRTAAVDQRTQQNGRIERLSKRLSQHRNLNHLPFIV